MSLFESGESSGEISLIDLFNGKDFDFVESKLTIDDLIFVSSNHYLFAAV